MSTGDMSTPGATLLRKTPRRPRVRKHGTNAKIEEIHMDGKSKTGEETIFEILGKLNKDFDRLVVADDEELEDVLDLLDQFHGVLEHHPEHGNLIGHIGGLQLQVKKFRETCEKNTAAIEDEMKRP